MTSIEEKIRQAASRNTELLLILSETDHAGPALSEQERWISNLESEIKASDNTIKNLDSKRKKEFTEHKEYRDSVVRRFAYKATGKKEKFEQRAAKEEREYFEALQQEHQAKEKGRQLNELLSDAIRAREDLRSQLDRHRQAQQDLDNLYDAIFQGPSPGFPEEDSSESRANEALQAYHDARTKAEAESQAIRILTDARKAVLAAQESMNSALSASRADMWGGSSVWDALERNALTRAEHQVNSASMLTNQAMFLSPQVMLLPSTAIAQGNLLGDVFFDNIFSDMAFHDKIKQSQVEVDACARAAGANLRAAQGRHASLEDTMNLKATVLDDARRGLQRTREEVFQRINAPKRNNNPFAS